MAALSELERAGSLFKVDPALQVGLVEERLMYATERVRRYFVEVVPTLGSTWNLELSPLEGLADFVTRFCSGEELTVDRSFRHLFPVGSDVWELKTAELRIFGWFHRKDWFVAVTADTKERVVEFGLYNGYVGEVVRYRDAIGLDEPKSVTGDNPNDVVSNYSYPDP